MSCLICSGETISTVTREKVPALQNRVYASASEARAARYGRLDIQACLRCGYAFNAAFDPALVEYDANYNNDVPSPTFDDYYRQIAVYLRERYLPHGGVVLDIGCGKGKFLQTLIGMFQDIEGIGIDPSCHAQESERLRLVPATFPEFMPEKKPDLVLCRHTLEHIANPVPFVRAIARGVPAGTPLFFEVPDAAWIVSNRAFWDWCYEHVNYFVADSAVAVMTAANVGRTKCTTAFGGQYLWVEGVAGAAESQERCCSDFAQSLRKYATLEAQCTSAARRQIEARKVAGNTVAVWGMATKGIEFVSLIDREAALIEFCVDMNQQKQDRFTPLTGRRIQSPAALRQAAAPLTVIVMNPCYLNEIRATCGQMAIPAECITL